MAEILLSREWKQALTTSKMKPFAMQVSLWDLLFFVNANNQVCVRYVKEPSETNWKCKGFELPHNIIILDEKMYVKAPETIRQGHRIIKYGDPTLHTPEDIVRNNLTTFDKWSSLGFDISLPWFDVRSKPLFLTSENYLKYISKATAENFSSLLNGLRPAKLENTDYYFNSRQNLLTRAEGFKIWDKEAALKPKTSYDFYIRSALKPITNYQPNTWEDYPEQWLVASEEDYVDLWKTPDSERNPGTKGADIILCNRDISFEKRFIIPESGYSAYNAICLNYTSPRIWQNFLKYYSAQDSAFNFVEAIPLTSDFTVGTINPVLDYMLKHCYVWFKCAFFADYIDYRDFNQSLNEKSQVIHNSLILGKGDFKRYESMYSEGSISPVDYAKNTRPYFPTTTPIKDKLKEVLLLTEEFTPDMRFVDAMNNIISNSNSPESKIGAVTIEPYENTGDPGSPPKSPNYTTGAIRSEPPPIWFDPESRKTSTDYSDLPILIGKEGNLITTGRLLSPTIDELWHTIKEMIAGKKSDLDVVEENDDAGYPKNINETSINSIDTRLKLPTHSFRSKTGASKKGDPTVISLQPASDNSNNLVYRVDSWINNPDSILYNVIKELKEASNLICSTAPNLETIVNKIENLPNPEKYLPMATVPSLRELEGLVKGLRWNLAYYIKFLLHNGVFIGSDGKKNTDTAPYNNAAGTAYLLHKDKNLISGINSPDTVYDERANRNLLPSTSYGIGVGKITADMFGNNNQDIIPPHTVFMSAAGTWQSVSQALNIRIRTDEVW